MLAYRPPVNEKATDAYNLILSTLTLPVQVAFEGPQALPARVPAPTLPQTDVSTSFSRPVEEADIALIQQAVAAASSEWNVPGTFHVNSLWQVSTDVQVISGFFDGVLLPGVISIATDGTTKFVSLPKSGGGGPATIHGVNGSWVLIQTGLGYAVFNIDTGEVHVSDEAGNPGQRTKLY